jgi:hypothetical protein
MSSKGNKPAAAHRVRTKPVDIFESEGVMFTASEESLFDETFSVSIGFEFKDWYKDVTSSEEIKQHNHVFFVKKSPINEKCFPCFQSIPPVVFTMKHNIKELDFPEKYKLKEFQTTCILCALDNDKKQKGCSMALVTRTLTRKDKSLSVDSLKNPSTVKKFFAFCVCHAHANQYDDCCNKMLIEIVKECLKSYPDVLFDTLVFRKHHDVYIKDIPKRTLKPALDSLTPVKDAPEQFEIIPSSSDDEDEEEDEEEEEEEEEEDGEVGDDIFSQLEKKQKEQGGGSSVENAVKEKQPEAPKEKSKEKQPEAPKEKAKEKQPEAPKEKAKEKQPEASKEKAKEKQPEAPKEKAKEKQPEASKEKAKEKQPEAPKEKQPEAPKEKAKEKQPEAPKEKQPEAPKEKAKEKQPEAPKEKQPEAPKEKQPEAPKEDPSDSTSKDQEMLENALKVIMGMKDKLKDNSAVQEREELIKENRELKRKFEQVTEEHNKLQKVTDSVIEKSDKMNSFLRAKYRQSLDHNKALDTENMMLRANLVLCDEKLSAFQHVAQDLPELRDRVKQPK